MSWIEDLFMEEIQYYSDFDIGTISNEDDPPFETGEYFLEWEAINPLKFKFRVKYLDKNLTEMRKLWIINDGDILIRNEWVKS